MVHLLTRGAYCLALSVAVPALAVGHASPSLTVGALAGLVLPDLLDGPSALARTRLLLGRHRGSLAHRLTAVLRLRTGAAGGGLHGVTGLYCVTAAGLLVSLWDRDRVVLGLLLGAVCHLQGALVAQLWTHGPPARWAGPRRARGLRVLEAHVYGTSLLGSVLFWLFLARLYERFAYPADLPPRDLLRHLLVAGTAAYVSAVALLSALLTRGLERRTGVRSRLSEDVGRVLQPPRGVLSRLSPRRADVVVVSALLAVLLLLTVEVLEQLAPAYLDVAGRPQPVAVLLPLVFAVTCWSARHTTAAGLGTLAGVLLVDLVDQVQSVLGSAVLSTDTSMALILGGIAGWASGLAFSSTSGSLGGSLVLVSVPLNLSAGADPRQPGRLSAVVDAVVRAHGRFSSEGVLFRTTPPRVSTPRRGDGVWLQEAGSDELRLHTAPTVLTVSCSYSPLQHETRSLVAVPSGGPRSWTALMPRCRSAHGPAHSLVRGARCRWVGDPSATAGLRSLRTDGAGFSKPWGETLDNLLTRRGVLRTDLLVEGAGADTRLVIAVAEHTSTKTYTTPEVEHLALLVCDEVAAATGAALHVERVSGGTSQHEASTRLQQVGISTRPPLPGPVLRQLSPASAAYTWWQGAVALTTVASLWPLLGLVSHAVRAAR